MLVLLTFLLALVSGLVHWAFLLRVRQILSQRHPGAWRAIAASRWGSISASQRFAWSSQAMRLDDPELVRNAKGLRWSHLASVAMIIAYPVVIALAR